MIEFYILIYKQFLTIALNFYELPAPKNHL